MELENALFGSESSPAREALLRKCRDTIKSLEDELENSMKTNFELETKIKELKNSQEGYLKEVYSKNCRLKELESENQEIEDKYQVFINKALFIQEQNEALVFELERATKRSKELETEGKGRTEYINELHSEIWSKNESIKSWNEAMVGVERKIQSLNEENYGLGNKLEQQIIRNEELVQRNKEISAMLAENRQKLDEVNKELGKCYAEKESVLISNKNMKEKQNFLEFELNVKTKTLKDLQTVVEELKAKLMSQDLIGNELNARLNVTAEELKAYRIKNESLERMLKEQTFKAQSDIERLTNTLDTKSSHFIKEDTQKSQTISSMENSIKLLKSELESLTSADSFLQTRYRDLLSKQEEKKRKIQTLESENDKLQESLSKFEERLKQLENNSLTDINALKSDRTNLVNKHKEELERKEKKFCSKLEKMAQEFSNKLKEAELENCSYKDEVARIKQDYRLEVNMKNEEILMLNNDRNKLQSALEELETKVIEMSRNLENSVGDCWKLSNELTRKNGLQQEELLQMSNYYKQLLLRKENEAINENFTRHYN